MAWSFVSGSCGVEGGGDRAVNKWSCKCDSDADM